MVQWIVDATIKAGCSRVVVVIGSHADEMRALIDRVAGAQALGLLDALDLGGAVGVGAVDKGVVLLIPLLFRNHPPQTSLFSNRSLN